MFALKGIWNNRDIIGSVIKDENTLLDDSYNSSMLFEVYNEESGKIDIVDLRTIYLLREGTLGVVCSKDYIYFCRVSDDLWRLLDYVDSPKQVFDNDVFRKDNDFLKDIDAEKNIIVRKDTLSIKEYKTGNRQIIVIMLGRSLSAFDDDNIFWIDSLGHRYSPSDSYKTLWLRNEDYFTLFDVYAHLANSNTNFDENSEVYFFGGSFRNAGYRLSMNADLVRFLTKIRCLRRGN